MEELNEQNKEQLGIPIYSIRDVEGSVSGETVKKRGPFRKGSFQPPEGKKSMHKSGNISLSDYVKKQWGSLAANADQQMIPQQPIISQQSKMRLAASYDPLLNKSSEILSENTIAKMKVVIKKLLSNPPHSTEVFKMKKMMKD